MSKSQQELQQSLEDIEKKMEDKILQYQTKMKNLEKDKIQPITLSLIQKFSFTRQFKNQPLVNDEVSETSSAQGQAQVSTEANSETQFQFEEEKSVYSDSHSQYSDAQNAEKMIYLKTIRLGFLNLGPKIENLDIFEHLENLYLQNNKFIEIGNGLQMNTRLQFLALQHNGLKKLEGMRHLVNLHLLDISHNQIEHLEVEELPVNLMILKIFENPFCKYEPDHRKRIVLYLEQLEELDRIKVIAAERLAYKGLVRVDVEKMLEKFREERTLKDAKQRMEKEMYLEYMDEIGVDSTMRMVKSLEEFAKVDEYSQLHSEFQSIMSAHKRKADLQDTQAETLRKEVEKQVNEVLHRYSRQGTRD